MSLITPTFADKVKAGEAPTQQGNGATPIRIAEQHEPLSQSLTGTGSPWNGLGAPLQLEQKTNVVPIVEPAPLKVALIGTAPSSRMLAPYNDPSWKIWACSPGNMNAIPKADVWFEIHKNLLWPECKSYGEP